MSKNNSLFCNELSKNVKHYNQLEYNPPTYNAVKYSTAVYNVTTYKAQTFTKEEYHPQQLYITGNVKYSFDDPSVETMGKQGLTEYI